MGWKPLSGTVCKKTIERTSAAVIAALTAELGIRS